MPAASSTSAVETSERICSEVDDTLARTLAEARERIGELDPSGTILVDEIVRLIGAGGKRLRPVFCVLGFRAAAADGDDGSIVEAASAVELLHTMALIHDDLIDESAERRGVASSHLRLADVAARSGSTEPDRTGRSLAIVAGDLATVLADRLFLGSGFPAERLVDALRTYASMRIEMAAGQVLDVMRTGDAPPSDRAARLRGGTYTVAGPLAIGAALGGGSQAVRRCLRAYGEPLGEAFQMMDDLRDADRGPVDRTHATSLAELAVAALRSRVLSPEVADVLRHLAERIGRVDGAG